MLKIYKVLLEEVWLQCFASCLFINKLQVVHFFQKFSPLNWTDTLL